MRDVGKVTRGHDTKYTNYTNYIKKQYRGGHNKLCLVLPLPIINDQSLIGQIKTEKSDSKPIWRDPPIYRLYKVQKGQEL